MHLQLNYIIYRQHITIYLQGSVIIHFTGMHTTIVLQQYSLHNMKKVPEVRKGLRIWGELISLLVESQIHNKTL